MFDWLFDESRWPPRRQCGSWSDELITLHRISELLIFSAYLAIPLVLLYFVARRPKVPNRLLLVLFALFIASCGFTHLVGYILFDHAYYVLDGVVKLFTGLISWATVLVLVPAIPKLLALRHPSELEEEILRRKQTEADLRQMGAELEAAINLRTAELLETNGSLQREVEARQKITDELATHAKNLVTLQQTTQESLAICDAVLHLAPVGIAIFDPEGRYLRVNKVLAAINGLPEEDHIGKTVAEVLPQAGRTVKRRLAEVLQNNNVILDDEVGGESLTEPGDQRRWVVSYYPVHTPDQRRLGVGVVIKDVTDQKRMESELRQRVRELAEMDRQKTEFLAMLAHELRNPLSPILNALTLLNRCADNNSEEANRGMREQARAMIDRQVRHMARLLDDLLDVSRIRRGKITLHKEMLDIRTVIRTAVENNRSASDTRGHQLHVQFVNGDCAFVNGDQGRLEQVFNNLLNNAIKYTEPGGHIYVTCTHSTTENGEGRVQVSVRDTGIGISAETLPKLFEMFTQASRSLDRAQGGLGIGLALVRDLVMMHGGQVSARSDGLGHGSEFIVRLPCLSRTELRHEARAPVLVRKPSVVARSLKVLVVDDNADCADSLAMLLTKAGHDVILVYDGATALRKVDCFHPEVILLDIGLPGLDGYTVAEMLREQGYTGYLVAITGYGSEEDQARSKQAGFDEHLVKPVDPDTLDQLLRTHADKRDVE